MQRILRRASGKRLSPVGSYHVGSTVYSLAYDKGKVVGLVDGYKIAEAETAGEGFSHVPVLLALVAARTASLQSTAVCLCPSSWKSAGTAEDACACLLKPTMDALKDAIGDSAIRSLDIPSEPGPASQRRVQQDLSVLSRNLSRYAAKVTESVKCSDRLLDRARVLLSRKVPGTMWGAQDLQRRLDESSCSTQRLKDQLATRSREAMMCKRAAESLSLRAAEGSLPSKEGGARSAASAEHSRYAQRILIPDVLVYHARLSSFFGELLVATSVLANLDRVVKRYTGYPSSFMFSSALQEDLFEAYAVLAKFLADIPSMERAVFEPLEYIQHAPLSP